MTFSTLCIWFSALPNTIIIGECCLKKYHFAESKLPYSNIIGECSLKSSKIYIWKSVFFFFCKWLVNAFNWNAQKKKKPTAFTFLTSNLWVLSESILENMLSLLHVLWWMLSKKLSLLDINQPMLSIKYPRKSSVTYWGVKLVNVT